MTLLNYIVYILVVSALLGLVCGQAADSAAPTPVEEVVTSQNITFHIEHALGPDRTFHPRARIQFIMKSDGRQGLKYLDKNTVTNGEELSRLRDLLNNNDLYTIRIRAEKDDWKGHFVLSSLPACELQKSGFKEDLQIFLGGSGNIIGMSYNVPKMAIAQDCDSSKVKDVQPFMTKIKIGDEQVAQSVPLQVNAGRPSNLQNVKLQADAEDESVKPKAQQSFLQRYWYIVVGLVMYLFMGGAPEPGKPAETKDGKPVEGGAAKPAVAAGAATAQAPSSSSRPKKDE